MDAGTEARLNQNLERQMKGKTSFLIAHRFSTIMRANRILMMEEGRITEQGTHQQLLVRSSRYRELYNLRRWNPSNILSTRWTRFLL